MQPNQAKIVNANILAKNELDPANIAEMLNEIIEPGDMGMASNPGVSSEFHGTGDSHPTDPLAMAIREIKAKLVELSQREYYVHAGGDVASALTRLVGELTKLQSIAHYWAGQAGSDREDLTGVVGGAPSL